MTERLVTNNTNVNNNENPQLGTLVESMLELMRGKPSEREVSAGATLQIEVQGSSGASEANTPTKIQGEPV